MVGLSAMHDRFLGGVESDSLSIMTRGGRQIVQKAIQQTGDPMMTFGAGKQRLLRGRGKSVELQGLAIAGDSLLVAFAPVKYTGDVYHMFRLLALGSRLKG